MENIYRDMFGRNIGIVSEDEQEKLSRSTIAVAGAGGVGGSALLNLVRIGIGNFRIADPETFAYSDINRQQGASHDNIGSKKTAILEKTMRSINPGVNISSFPEGLTEENIEKFLDGASLVIDGLDFFCLKLRKQLFDCSRQRGLYLLSCPIFGFGTSLAVFSPFGPSFDKLFGPVPEKIDASYFFNFGCTFFPKFPKYINIQAYIEAMNKGRPIPSFATSCALSGSVTAAEAVFILLNKRKITCAPLVRHYDLFDAQIKVLDGRKIDRRIFRNIK